MKLLNEVSGPMSVERADVSNNFDVFVSQFECLRLPVIECAAAVVVPPSPTTNTASLSRSASSSSNAFLPPPPQQNSCAAATGLPLTPYPIRVLGRFHSKIKSLKSSQSLLSPQLDCIRSRFEKVELVQAIPKGYLSLAERSLSSDQSMFQAIIQVLEGLNILHTSGVAHMCLEPGNIFISGNESNSNEKIENSTDLYDPMKVCLYNFGMGFITNYGEFVDFPIFNPRYASPQNLFQFHRAVKSCESSDVPEEESAFNDHESSKTDMEYISSIICKNDVWSIGMILFTHVLQIMNLKSSPSVGNGRQSSNWLTYPLQQVLRKVISFRNFRGSILDRLCKDHEIRISQYAKSSNFAENIVQMMNMCLQVDCERRPTVAQLISTFKPSSLNPSVNPPSFDRNVEPVKFSDFYQSLRLKNEKCNDSNLKSWLNIEDIYHIFSGFCVGGKSKKSASGDSNMGGGVGMPHFVGVCGTILPLRSTSQHENSKPYDPSERWMLKDFAEGGPPSTLFSDTSFLFRIIPDARGTFPLDTHFGDSKKKREEVDPVLSRIQNLMEYKFLINGCPFLIEALKSKIECDRNVPEMYRNQIWMILLGVDVERAVKHYTENINPDEMSSEALRQIDVDIPRCHQYNSLLVSPSGHDKLRETLQGWTVSNAKRKGYVYWQGLDSLAAPHIHLHFSHPQCSPISVECMQHFVDKYLDGMFVKENGEVIKRYLNHLRYFQAFHDPELFKHMERIGFIPDLFAIPWILTMFAHIFSLYDIFQLWDILLLKDKTFPLAISMAILKQLRGDLLSRDFNESILLFSDLPIIRLDECISDALSIHHLTPNPLLINPAIANPSKKDIISMDHDQVLPHVSIHQFIQLFENNTTLSTEQRKKMPVVVIEMIDTATDSENSSTFNIKDSLKVEVRPPGSYQVDDSTDDYNEILNCENIFDSTNGANFGKFCEPVLCVIVYNVSSCDKEVMECDDSVKEIKGNVKRQFRDLTVSILVEELMRRCVRYVCVMEHNINTLVDILLNDEKYAHINDLFQNVIEYQ